MSKIARWLLTSCKRPKKEVEQPDFNSVSELLAILSQEDGIVPGHP